MNMSPRRINEKLAGTAAGRLLSKLGRRIFMPEDITVQAGQATRSGARPNATAGMMLRNGRVCVLPALAALLPAFEPEEVVAYAPTPGDPAFRVAWKDRLRDQNPSLDVERCSLPLVVPGLTAGLSLAADLFVDPGDTVILPEPRWSNYDLLFGVKKGARIVSVPLFDARGGLNIPGFERALNGRRKSLLVLNFPQNPTGYTPSREEAARLLERLRAVAGRGRDILALCDDAYFGLFYGESVNRESLFAPLASASSGILAVKTDGPTKEDLAWGLRTAFVTFGGQGLERDALAALEEKAQALGRATWSSASRAAQSLLLKAWAEERTASDRGRFFAEMETRHKIVRSLVDAPGRAGSSLNALPYNSGYFVCFRYSGDAERLRRDLLEKSKIGTVSLPGGYLRIAYSAVDAEDLVPMFEKIFSSADRLAVQ